MVKITLNIDKKIESVNLKEQIEKVHEYLRDLEQLNELDQELQFQSKLSFPSERLIELVLNTISILSRSSKIRLDRTNPVVTEMEFPLEKHDPEFKKLKGKFFYDKLKDGTVNLIKKKDLIQMDIILNSQFHQTLDDIEQFFYDLWLNQINPRISFRGKNEEIEKVIINQNKDLKDPGFTSCAHCRIAQTYFDMAKEKFYEINPKNLPPKEKKLLSSIQASKQYFLRKYGNTRRRNIHGK